MILPEENRGTKAAGKKIGSAFVMSSIHFERLPMYTLPAMRSPKFLMCSLSFKRGRRVLKSASTVGAVSRLRVARIFSRFPFRVYMTGKIEEKKLFIKIDYRYTRSD